MAPAQARSQLLGLLARVAVFWLIFGRKVRARYRQCQARGETFWLDDLDPARRGK